MASPRIGIVERVTVFFRGDRPRDLEEETHHMPLIGYLILLATSLSVVLVFGHSDLVQVFSPGPVANKLPSAVLLFVLVMSVIGADIAAVASMSRMGVLARNRSPMFYEHVLYTAFVLFVEIGTFGTLLTATAHDPSVIFSTQTSIIPVGTFSTVMTWCRAAFLGIAFIQLVITSTKLPTGISTLENQSKGIMGGLALAQLQNTEFAPQALGTLYRAVAKVDRRPPRKRTWYNGWLCDLEEAQEAARIARAEDIADTLDELAGDGVAGAVKALQVRIVELEDLLERERAMRLQELSRRVATELLYYAQHRTFSPDLIEAAPELETLGLPGGMRGTKLPKNMVAKGPTSRVNAQKMLFKDNGIEPIESPAGRNGCWVNRRMIEWATDGKLTGEPVTNLLKMLGGKQRIGTSYVAPFDATFRELSQKNLLGDVARIFWETSGFGMQIVQDNNGETRMETDEELLG